MCEERACRRPTCRRSGRRRRNRSRSACPRSARDLVTEAKMWGVTPIDQMLCRIEFRKLRYEGPLTPPSLARQPAVSRVRGRHELGQRRDRRSKRRHDRQRAADRVTTCSCIRAPRSPRRRASASAAACSTARRMLRTRSPFLSPIFAPCQQPPYGEIAAVDLQHEAGALAARRWAPRTSSARSGSRRKLPIPMGVPVQRRHGRDQGRSRVHGRHDGSAPPRARHADGEEVVERRAAQQRAGHADELRVAAAPSGSTS